MKRLTLKIYGLVQGVGFRWSTRRQATSLGVVGYVKNLRDGTVEMIAEGEEEALKKLLEWCKIGPSWAGVSRVEERWEEIDKKQFTSFQIEF